MKVIICLFINWSKSLKQAIEPTNAPGIIMLSQTFNKCATCCFAYIIMRFE